MKRIGMPITTESQCEQFSQIQASIAAKIDINAGDCLPYIVPLVADAGACSQDYGADAPARCDGA